MKRARLANFEQLRRFAKQGVSFILKAISVFDIQTFIRKTSEVMTN